ASPRLPRPSLPRRSTGPATPGRRAHADARCAGAAGPGGAGSRWSPGDGGKGRAPESKDSGAHSVGDTGFEPVTSSVSGKRATAAPIARGCCYSFVLEVGTGFEPV